MTLSHHKKISMVVAFTFIENSKSYSKKKKTTTQATLKKKTHF